MHFHHLLISAEVSGSLYPGVGNDFSDVVQLLLVFSGLLLTQQRCSFIWFDMQFHK